MRLVALALLAACSGKRSDERAPAQDPPSGQRAEDPWAAPTAHVPPAPPPDTVVVDDPGTEPRRVLAYTLAPYERTLDYKVDIAEQKIAWSCAAGGKCTYRILSFMVGTDNEFDMVAKSSTGDATVSADGRVLVQPSSLLRLSPSTPELIELSIAPLPKTAVGLGAKWHLGARAYRVTKLSPLELAVTSSAADETFDGTLSIDLAQPIATALTATDTVTMKRGPGEPHLSPIEQKITLR